MLALFRQLAARTLNSISLTLVLSSLRWASRFSSLALASCSNSKPHH